MNQVTAQTFRMTGERDSALDLAQDTFVSAWENIGTFRGESNFAGWVSRIASNKSLNFIKARARRQTTGEVSEQLPDSTAVSPERQLFQNELADRVLEFMHNLPPQQRAIFELRFYKQLSFEEIAKTTDRALGTVKTGYREAVKKLRTMALAKGYR